jgi:FixJ family two-component response regulator
VARVLTVDNDAQVLAVTSNIVQRAGHQVECLSSSRQFMVTFVRFKPDVVILDVLMPDLDGIEIIHWLADVDYTGSLILMSGEGRYLNMAVALASANDRMAVASLMKPFRASDLESTLGGMRRRTSAH